MNVDMNKIKAQMNEHWDMDAATFDTYQVNEIHIQETRAGEDTGGREIDFKDANGDVKFYIEVYEDNEVWHFDWVH